MPLNQRRIVDIILDQKTVVEERCDGYQDEIIEVITDILEYERDHRVQATNIQKRINAKCNGVAQFLAEQRNRSSDT